MVLDVAHQPVVTAGEFDQLLLDAADVAQPQHRAAADGAAFRLDRLAGRAGRASSRSRGLRARSRVDRLLHALRGGAAPASCRKRARVRRAARHEQRRCRREFPAGRRPPAHSTSTCGCDSSSAFSRSISACSSPSPPRARRFRRGRGAPRAQQRHGGRDARSRSGRASAPAWRIPAGRWRRRSPARRHRARRRPAPACRDPSEDMATAGGEECRPASDENAASRSPPGSSPAFRLAPRMRGGVRHAVRELSDFTPAGTRAERVQTVNGRAAARSLGVISAPSARRAMSSTLMRPSAVENMRSASASAGRTTLLTSGEPGSGGSPASSAALGGAQDVLGGDVACARARARSRRAVRGCP